MRSSIQKFTVLAVIFAGGRKLFVEPRDVSVQINPSYRSSSKIVSTRHINCIWFDVIDTWVDHPFGCEPFALFSWSPLRLLPTQKNTNAEDAVIQQFREKCRPANRFIHQTGRVVSRPTISPIHLIHHQPTLKV